MLLILVQVQQEGEKGEEGEKEIEMTNRNAASRSFQVCSLSSLQLTFDFRNQKIPTGLNNKGNYCLT